MRKTALITGASSGIGYQLAMIHAQKGDNLVLVSRNHLKLNDLKSHLELSYAISVMMVKMDLSEPDSAQELYDQLKKDHVVVDYLVNNAGFCYHGLFMETEWQREEKMINLHITTLTHLCKLFGKDMIERGCGRILNVTSTAAFQPGPSMSVYFASKAYILHFSEALNKEFFAKGVSVTALCPGPTNSEFQKNADLVGSNLFRILPVSNAREVARYAHKAMLKGKAVAVHGWINKMIVLSLRFVPRKLVVFFSGLLLSKS